MAKKSGGTQINVRGVPDDVLETLDEKAREHRVSRNELLVGLLKKASTGDMGPSLFDMTPPPPAPVVAPETLPFRFIDLFAGIGGFRLGLSAVGGRCVFTSEWDPNSKKTYKHWFGEEPHGDIKEIEPKDIPDHDVLAAGFPCQPFSIAGVSKKNALGHAHGFKCATQGTLFYNVASVIEAKRPPVVMLENVKNLLGHDKGRTWRTISQTLEELQYVVFHKVIDAATYVPQHRERVFIVCFDRKEFGDNVAFEFPKTPNKPAPKLRDILEPDPPEKYTLTDHLWNYLQRYAEKHAAKGNGFGFGMANLDGVTRTLSARYFKDGSEILIPQGGGKNPRRLTPLECMRLMGFPADRLGTPPVSDTQAYRQFGNALCPLIAEDIARQMIKVLAKHIEGRCLVKRKKSG